MYGTVLFHFSPVYRGIVGGTVAVAQATGFRAHYHQIGSDAGTSHVWGDDTAGVAQSAFDGQRVFFGVMRRRLGRKRARRPEIRAHSLVVVRSHFQRQTGYHEQLIEDLVYFVILFRRRLHEHASRILCFAVGRRFFNRYCSEKKKKEKRKTIARKQKRACFFFLPDNR